MKIFIDLKDLQKFNNDFRALIIYNKLKPMKEFWYRSDKWAERFGVTTQSVNNSVKILKRKGYVKERYHQPSRYMRTKKYRMLKLIAE